MNALIDVNLLVVSVILAPGLVIACDKIPTPAAQFQAIQRDAGAAARALYEAANDDDRKKAADLGASVAPRCWELAEKYPNDPIAFDVLVQIVNQEIWLLNNTLHPGRGDGLEGKAVARLLRDHLKHEKLGYAAWRASYGFSSDCEKLLRTALVESPHRDVKGQACLRLAQFLHSRQHRLDLLRDKPEMAKRYEGIFGKKQLDTFIRQDRPMVMKEVETLFELALEKYPDVKSHYGDLVGEKAKKELHEIRHLVVGKVAQDIEGVDQDGKKFKLSDYRGKVVLLYFWTDI